MVNNIEIDQYHLFLSYAIEDSVFADRLEKHLTTLGVKVWHDKKTVKLGESIRRSIEEGITHSKFVLLLLSKSSIQKLSLRVGYLVFEEYLASIDQDILNKLRVIPAVIDDTVRTNDIPLKYRDRKYVDLCPTYYNAGVQNIVTELGMKVPPSRFINPKDGSELVLLKHGHYRLPNEEISVVIEHDYYISTRRITARMFYEYLVDVYSKEIANICVRHESDNVQMDERCVKMVNFVDAAGYAAWTGLRLPSIFELEYLILGREVHGYRFSEVGDDYMMEWTSSVPPEIGKPDVNNIHNDPFSQKAFFLAYGNLPTDLVKTYWDWRKETRMGMFTRENVIRAMHMPASATSKSSDITFRCACNVDTIYSQKILDMTI